MLWYLKNIYSCAEILRAKLQEWRDAWKELEESRVRPGSVVEEGQPELQAVLQQVDVTILGQVCAQLQHGSEEGEKAFADCAKALHDEDEGGEDGASEHVVTGALLPEGGQVVKEGRTDWPDGDTHPLDQVGEDIQHVELCVALRHFLEKREKQAKDLLQVRLQLLDREFKVIDDNLHGFGSS